MFALGLSAQIHLEMELMISESDAWLCSPADVVWSS
jgi:hypothetical protein